MKNVFKVAAVAAAVSFAGAAQAAESWASISSELGKYGIDLTADQIKTQVMGDSGFEINADYNTVLKTTAAVEAATEGGDSAADVLDLILDMKAAKNTWSSNGAKTVQTKDSANFITDWDNWAAGLIEDRADDIVSEIDDYMGDVGTATGGIIDDFVDGTLEADTDKINKADAGLDLLVYVVGGTKAIGVRDTSGNKAKNHNDYQGSIVTKFVTDLDSDLSDTASADDIKSEFKGNVQISGEMFEQTDFTFAVNSDGDYEVSGISSDFLTVHSISNQSDFKVELYDLSLDNSNKNSSIYKDVTIDGNAVQVQLSDWITN